MLPENMNEDSNYFYRIDSIRSLKIIQDEGFRCGPASRITHFGLKSETLQAEEQGFPVPPKDLQDAPRIYFYSTFEQAEKELEQFHRDFITRYSRSKYPLSDSTKHFADGAWYFGAIYVVLPEFQIEDVVINATDIEILSESSWILLKTFNFDVLDFVRCSFCHKPIKKSDVAEYRSLYQVNFEKIFCEECSKPIIRVA